MTVTYDPNPPWPFAASATDYGRDLSCIEDLDQNMSEARGRQVLIEALARMIITPAGTLPPAGPNDTASEAYGFDLTQFINADVDAATLSDIQGRVRTQFLLDDRVRDAVVSIVFLDSALTVSATIYDARGPFKFTRLITDVTASFLDSGA